MSVLTRSWSKYGDYGSLIIEPQENSIGKVSRGICTVCGNMILDSKPEKTVKRTKCDACKDERRKLLDRMRYYKRRLK